MYFRDPRAYPVIPAQAGIHVRIGTVAKWIPACAGMTSESDFGLSNAIWVARVIIKYSSASAHETPTNIRRQLPAG